MTMMTRPMRLPIPLLAAALLAGTVPATAGTATTTFAVNATVVATCSVSAGPLNFGAAIPSPVNDNIDATGTITATCSSSVPYNVALSAGQGAAATMAVRKLTSGTNAMDYALYTDAARSSVWGDGTAGSVVNNLTGTGAAQAITVFGRIPAGQAPMAGIYSDRITVTVNF